MNETQIIPEEEIAKINEFLAEFDYGNAVSSAAKLSPQIDKTKTMDERRAQAESIVREMVTLDPSMAAFLDSFDGTLIEISSAKEILDTQIRFINTSITNISPEQLDELREFKNNITKAKRNMTKEADSQEPKFDRKLLLSYADSLQTIAASITEIQEHHSKANELKGAPKGEIGAVAGRG